MSDDTNQKWAIKVPFGKDYDDNPDSWMYVVDYDNIEEVKLYDDYEKAVKDAKVWRVHAVVKYGD